MINHIYFCQLGQKSSQHIQQSNQTLDHCVTYIFDFRKRPTKHSFRQHPHNRQLNLTDTQRSMTESASANTPQPKQSNSDQLSGSLISVITNAMVRYEGTLQEIDR